MKGETFGNLLFDHIKHGDDKHKAWLKKTIAEFFKNLHVIGTCGECEHSCDSRELFTVLCVLHDENKHLTFGCIDFEDKRENDG